MPEITTISKGEQSMEEYKFNPNDSNESDGSNKDQEFKPKNTVQDVSPEMNYGSRKPVFQRSKLNEETPTWKKALYFLFGFIGLTLISVVVQYVFIALGYYDSSAKSFTLKGQVYVNFFTYLIAFIGFMLFIFLDSRKSYATIFGGYKKIKTVMIFAVIGLGLIYFVNVISNVITNLSGLSSSNNNQTGISSIIQTSPVLGFFMVVIFAPICEELTYRAGLCDLIGKNKRWLGIVCSAVIFGFIHFDFTSIISVISPATSYKDATGQIIQYTAEQLASNHQAALITLYTELINLPVYILSGMVLAFIYCSSGELATSITAHSFINFISFISIIISNRMANYSSSSTNIVRIFEIFSRL